MKDSAFEKVGLRLKVGIKNGHKLILLDVLALHGRFQVPCLEPCAAHAVLIHYIDSPLVLLGHFALYQETGLHIRRIVQHLNQNAAQGPIQLANCGYGLLIHLHAIEAQQKWNWTTFNLALNGTFDAQKINNSIVVQSTLSNDKLYIFAHGPYTLMWVQSVVHMSVQVVTLERLGLVGFYHPIIHLSDWAAT